TGASAAPSALDRTSTSGPVATGAGAARAAATGVDASDVIPVVREELEVGKRTVGTGAVRVYARAVTTPVSETVALRSEHAEIERRPVDRPATAEDLAALRDRTVEVRETAEKAV